MCMATRPESAASLTPFRTYKARLFELNLEINTLRNAIYMSMHNDISFVIDSRLTLYEHPSTYSPNLPLRFLLKAG